MIEDPGPGVDYLTLVHGAGGVLQHAALRGNIALQNGDGPLFRGLFHREDHLFAGQAVVGQIPKVPVKPVVFLQVLQIFAQSFACDGHDVQVQHIPQQPLHHRHAAGKPEGFRQVLAGGIDVAQMGDLVIDFVKKVDGQVIAQFPSDGGEVNGGVGRPADGAVDDNGVAEGGGGHDLAGGDAFFRQLHDFASGISGVLKDIPHGGGHQGRAGQGHAQGLGHALHGGGGAQEGAGSHRGAAGQLIIPDLLVGDGILALLTQGDVPGYQGGGLVGAGPHGAAGHENGGNIHPGGGLQMGGNGLVAAGRQDDAVPGHCGGVYFHHVGNGLPGGQDHVHAVVPLGAAVADIGGVVFGRLSAPLVHAVDRLLGHLVEVIASGMGVAIHALHHNLRTGNVLVVPAGAHFQGVKLSPEQTFFFASLLHNTLPPYQNNRDKRAEEPAACHSSKQQALLTGEDAA